MLLTRASAFHKGERCVCMCQETHVPSKEQCFSTMPLGVGSTVVVVTAGATHTHGETYPGEPGVTFLFSHLLIMHQMYKPLGHKDMHLLSLCQSILVTRLIS